MYGHQLGEYKFQILEVKGLFKSPLKFKLKMKPSLLTVACVAGVD